KQDPVYIVAGEIVRTSRMYAMSVSPLTKNILNQLSPDLLQRLENNKSKKTLEKQAQTYEKSISTKKKERETGKKEDTSNKKNEDILSFGGTDFIIKKVKGQKQVQLDFDNFITAVKNETDKEKLKVFGNIKSKLIFKNGFILLENEKLSTTINVYKTIPLTPIQEEQWNRKLNIHISEPDAAQIITNAVENILKVTVAKQKSKEYGFICLFTDGNGTYWNKVSRGLSTAVNESLSSLEHLFDEGSDLFTDEQKDKINAAYRTVNSIIS
ncbi:MAG: ATP-dependent RNA helicase, partial [Treponema sp.]|nr:ATP-dependent RNA helicase [Treponema sp.]